MRESKYLQANIDNIEKLMNIPILKKFEPKDLREILKRSKIRQYESGELILKKDDLDTHIFFLLSGQVKIVKNDEELTILKRSGDLFGEMGFISNSGRSASVYAITKVVCLTTDVAHIDGLAGHDRTIFFYMLYRIFAEILAERLRFTSEELLKAKKEIAKIKSKE